MRTLLLLALSVLAAAEDHCSCCTSHQGRCAFKTTTTVCTSRDDCKKAYPDTLCYCIPDGEPQPEDIVTKQWACDDCKCSKRSQTGMWSCCNDDQMAECGLGLEWDNERQCTASCNAAAKAA